MASLSLTFLGTGTSGGIPLIACDCAVCTSPDPRDKRTRTGACVRWLDDSGQERCVLIDATPDLRLQAIREDLWRCDAILFTHNHVDHIFGLDEVRRFNAVMRAPIDVYAERSVLDALRRVYKHIFEQASNINDSFVATLIAHEIASPPADGGAGTPIDLFGVRFTPIRLLHGRLPILGYVIEESIKAPKHQDTGGQATSGTRQKDITPDSSPPALMPHASCHVPSPLMPYASSLVPSSKPFPLAYCTDVSAIPPGTWKHLTGLSTLVLDALRHRHHPTHFTLEQALHVAERVRAKETYFIHMAHELGHESTSATLPEHVHLAYDGLTLGTPIPPGKAWRPTSRRPAATGPFYDG